MPKAAFKYFYFHVFAPWGAIIDKLMWRNKLTELYLFSTREQIKQYNYCKVSKSWSSELSFFLRLLIKLILSRKFTHILCYRKFLIVWELCELSTYIVPLLFEGRFIFFSLIKTATEMDTKNKVKRMFWLHEKKDINGLYSRHGLKLTAGFFFFCVWLCMYMACVWDRFLWPHIRVAEIFMYHKKVQCPICAGRTSHI